MKTVQVRASVPCIFDTVDLPVLTKLAKNARWNGWMSVCWIKPGSGGKV